MSYDTIVIGGGLGGLASAALLAHHGQRVLLCESEDRLGGFQHRFESGGFRFEPNFHFLQDAAAGRPVQQLLATLGIEHTFRRLDPVARLYYPDGTRDIPNDRAAFIDGLERDFPSEANGIDALFAESLALYRALTRQQPSPLLATYGGDTMHDFVARFVHDPRLQAITSAWAAYFGYGSAQITALGIIVFTESCWDGGIHHPVGGIGAIIDTLRATIEQHSGDIRLATPVSGIMTRNARTCGVRLRDGSVVQARAVISTIDTLSTLRDMIDDPSLATATAAPFAGIVRFRSPFAVYLGVRSDGLDLDTGAAVRITFRSYDLQAQDRAQCEGNIENAPLPMGIPTRVTPELAPSGHHIVILYTFMPGSSVQALLQDSARANTFAQRMVRRAEQAIPGLGRNIVVMETSASRTRMLYNPNSLGALGWSPHPHTLPRMPDHRSSIAGLFLAGQWTRSGGGINNVLASAQAAASLALAESTASA
jgi:all-trans-retinol 13,14-reductase